MPRNHRCNPQNRHEAPDIFASFLIVELGVFLDVLADNDAIVQAAVVRLARSRTNIERLELFIVCAFDRAENLIGNHEEIFEVNDKTPFHRTFGGFRVCFALLLRLRFRAEGVSDDLEKFRATFLSIDPGSFRTFPEYVTHALNDVFDTELRIGT